jgi:3-deoxy-D-manno-octulosonic-acid transferase
VVIAGSTWPPDEELLVPFINQSDRNVKWIIAPHEIPESGIKRLAAQLKKKIQLYTELSDSELPNTDVIIVNTIGILSSLYQYGKIAYIGGGFGKGIHNTLEAATFGLPVIFGPKYHKFKEAVDLVDAGAAFPIHDYQTFSEVLSRLLENPERVDAAGGAARKLVQANLGAAEKILDRTLDRPKST